MHFSKAINKLWQQNLISNVEIYFTKLIGKNLYVEISITERPRLSNFKFVGVKKGEADDLVLQNGIGKRKSGYRKHEAHGRRKYQEILC